MKNCLNCNKELNALQEKFCSSSCSATYNNRGRIRTTESRAKISGIIQKFYFDNPEVRTNSIKKLKITCGKRNHTKTKVCPVCKKEFISARKNTNYYPRLCSDVCLLESKRKCARGNKAISYNGVKFDSNWELELATHLDKNKSNGNNHECLLYGLISIINNENIFQIFIYQNIKYI